MVRAVDPQLVIIYDVQSSHIVNGLTHIEGKYERIHMSSNIISKPNGRLCKSGSKLFEVLTQDLHHAVFSALKLDSTYGNGIKRYGWERKIIAIIGHGVQARDNSSFCLSSILSFVCCHTEHQASGLGHEI